MSAAALVIARVGCELFATTIETALLAHTNQRPWEDLAAWALIAVYYHFRPHPRRPLVSRHASSVGDGDANVARTVDQRFGLVLTTLLAVGIVSSRMIEALDRSHGLVSWSMVR